MRGRATPCFPRHIISKSQDSILRLVAGTPAGRDACLDETVPHHLDVRGGVSVSCGDLGVAEPSLDCEEIYARPKELHGERMPKDVR